MSSSHLRIRSAAPLRALFAAAVYFACGLSLAQTINDVPMAVKNNVPPNFMFMLDSSGSMLHIVPNFVCRPNAAPAKLKDGLKIFLRCFLARCPSSIMRAMTTARAVVLP